MDSETRLLMDLAAVRCKCVLERFRWVKRGIFGCPFFVRDDWYESLKLFLFLSQRGVTLC